MPVYRLCLGEDRDLLEYPGDLAVGLNIILLVSEYVRKYICFTAAAAEKEAESIKNKTTTTIYIYIYKPQTV